jgi:hypothetical protein
MISITPASPAASIIWRDSGNWWNDLEKYLNHAKVVEFFGKILLGGDATPFKHPPHIDLPPQFRHHGASVNYPPRPQQASILTPLKLPLRTHQQTSVTVLAFTFFVTPVLPCDLPPCFHKEKFVFRQKKSFGRWLCG